MTARQKVLAHLKKTRSASAREIARALKMTAPNVRHHLSVLCSDGRAEFVSVNNREGRGRPEKMYSLSQAARGDNLAVLVEALLNEKINPQKIGFGIARSQGLIEASVSQPMTKRLAFLVDKLNEMNYQSHWEAGAEGPRVILGRCPYWKVIEKHPELCKMDEVLLQCAMARPVIGEQKGERIHGICPFIFQIG
ncbi:MAG: ArsR family transcriptional regulator [Anaerolineales bacterium]|nr:ArsR family transcriptional regulator [Anaerolineales bacterium]